MSMATRRTKPPLAVSGYALPSEQEVLRALGQVKRRQRLSTKTVAERMGVAPSVVSRLENQRKHPTFETLQRYAAAIGCEIGLVVVQDGRTIF